MEMGEWNRLRKHSHDSEGRLYPSNTRKTFKHRDYYCSEMEERQRDRLAVEATQSLAPKTNSRIRNLTTLTEDRAEERRHDKTRCTPCCGFVHIHFK